MSQSFQQIREFGMCAMCVITLTLHELVIIENMQPEKFMITIYNIQYTNVIDDIFANFRKNSQTVTIC